MRVGTSFAIFMSHYPGRRQMAHTPSRAIEENLIKRLKTVQAEFKERDNYGAELRMGTSERSSPAQA